MSKTILIKDANGLDEKEIKAIRKYVKKNFDTSISQQCKGDGVIVIVDDDKVNEIINGLKSVVPTSSIKIADEDEEEIFTIPANLASTDYLHGDGFYPITKTKMAKVEPGDDLSVYINDYYALCDNIILAKNGVRTLDWSDKGKTWLEINRTGEFYILLKPTDDSKKKHKKHSRGEFFLSDTKIEDTITVAKLNIPEEATQITDDMIDNSVKKWLVDIDKGLWDLKKYVDEAVERAKREIYAFILNEYTDQIRDEIAAGDDAVRSELDLKIASVQSQIDDISIAIEDIRTSLADLQNYVSQKIQSLEEISENLSQAIENLNNAVTENSVFIQQLSDNIKNIEGDIVAIQIELEKQLQMIEELENQNIITAGKWEQTNAINNAKNTFRISVIDRKVSGVLKNGFYDTFEDDSGIDDQNSQDYRLENGYITTGSGLSIPERCAGLWKMDTGYGNIIIDDSNKGNDGIIRGANWSDGKYGKALSFDGIDDYVSLPANIITSNNSFTIALWFKRERTGKEVFFSHLLGYAFVVKTWYGYSTVPNNSIGVYMETQPSGAVGVGSSDTVITDNNWHHFVIVKRSDGDGIEMWLDGNKISNLVYQYGEEYKLDDLRPSSFYNEIGAYHSTSRNQYFQGKIDELAIFNKVLTEQEILSCYNNPIGIEISQAAVQSKAYTASSSPDTVIVIAEDTGNVTYEVSRDGGTTWTAATKNVETDISSQPVGTSIVLKATIPAGEKIDNWALLWA